MCDSHDHLTNYHQQTQVNQNVMTTKPRHFGNLLYINCKTTAGTCMHVQCVDLKERKTKKRKKEETTMKPIIVYCLPL